MADWDDLRVFLAVARNESLSGAGRVLKCDAATVGRRIARFARPFMAIELAGDPGLAGLRVVLVDRLSEPLVGRFVELLTLSGQISIQ